ncbi:MAG: integrase, partial [Desulfobacteraceae bacterium]|nr:integrase [Desulfobacteraceae bacterium]
MEHAQAKFCKKVYAEKKLAFREFFKSVSLKLEPARLHPGMLLKHFNVQAKRRSGDGANKDRKNLLVAWNWAQKYLPRWPKENPVKLCERQDAEQHPRYIPPVEDFWKVYDAAKEGQDKT